MRGRPSIGSERLMRSSLPCEGKPAPERETGMEKSDIGKARFLEERLLIACGEKRQVPRQARSRSCRLSPIRCRSIREGCRALNPRSGVAPSGML